MSEIGIRTPASPPAVRLLFDGQSFNTFPALGVLGAPYTYHLTRGRGIPWGTVSVGGTSWATLLTTAATRLYPLLDRAADTVLVMCGGTTSINEGRTGAQLYADEVAYADAARTAGASKVISMTLLGSTSFNAGEETARQDSNTLRLADGDDAFDGVADVDAAFVSAYGASYWTDEDVLFDGTHAFGESTELYAATVAPVLDTVLASL